MESLANHSTNIVVTVKCCRSPSRYSGQQARRPRHRSPEVAVGSGLRVPRAASPRQGWHSSPSGCIRSRVPGRELRGAWCMRDLDGAASPRRRDRQMGTPQDHVTGRGSGCGLSLKGTEQTIPVLKAWRILQEP